MTVVISDTSPVTNLIQINNLQILQQLFQEVIITQSVYSELCKLPFQKSIIDKQTWISIRRVANEKLVEQLSNDLDKGEAESIALALDMKADILLIDERKGRNIAEKMGLKIVGLLGILTEAKKEGLIISVKLLLDQLIIHAGFRISPYFIKGYWMKQVKTKSG